MTENIYKQLAAHLNELPGGFPPSDSGVELQMLKRLFTPEEAAFDLHLALIPEEPNVLARRAGISTEAAAHRLEEMVNKGLVFRLEEKPDKPMYMATQYVIGIWEFNVDNLDPELIEYMAQYKKTLFQTAWKRPQLRTVPIGKSIHRELQVMTYERAETLVASHDRFAVNPCICRRENRIMGKGCDKPEHSCLAFGMVADYSIHRGYGRATDKEEILAILEKADSAGLVLLPGNFREADYICCCCGCCCGVLNEIKQLPQPARHVSTPFVLSANSETCEGCGLCEDRCQMEALRLVHDRVRLDADRCIGCGLCVSTCPTGSLTLKRKPDDEQMVVPRDAVAAAIAHGRARGKLGFGELLKMQIRSKVDRILAQ